METRYIAYDTDESGEALSPPPYLVAQDARTSLTHYSNNLTNALTSSGDIDITFDEVGLDGSANSATKLVANTSIVDNWIRFWSPSPPVDGQMFTSVFYFKKTETDTGEYPGVSDTLLEPTAYSVIQLNLFTGDTIEAIGSGDMNKTIEVEDAGDWWKLYIQQENLAASTIISRNIYPTSGTVWGVHNPKVAGQAVVVGNNEFYYDLSIADIKGMGPIFTESTTVTTGPLNPTFNELNHSDSEGPYGMKLDWSGDDVDVLTLSDTGGAYLKVEDGDVGNPELLINGNFDDNTDGWATFNATKSHVNNACRIDSTAVFGYLRGAIACPTEAGVEYYYEIDVIDTDAIGSLYMTAGTSVGGSDLANINTGTIGLGIRSITFTATSTTSYVQIGVNGDGKYTTMDNISVKKAGKILTLTDQTNSVSLPMPTAPAEVEAAVLYEQGDVGAEEVEDMSASQWQAYSNGTVIDEDGGIKATYTGNTTVAVVELDAATSLFDDLVTGKTYIFSCETKNDIVGGTSTYFELRTYLPSVSVYETLTKGEDWTIRTMVFEVTSLSTAPNFRAIFGDQSVWVRNISIKEVIKGKMQLQLGSTLSPVVDYEDSFGTGDLTVGENIRDLKRWHETTITTQIPKLNQIQLTVDGEPVYNNGYPVYE